MSNLFNKKMDIDEARSVLYRAIDGKTKAERDEILAEYNSLFPKMMDNYLEKNREYLV